MQHDRNLTRAVDAKTLVAILRSCEDVNMVSLLTKTTMHHSIRVQSRCMQALQGCPITAPEWAALAQPRLVVGVRLVRMLQWLDSTHIAKVSFFRTERTSVLPVTSSAATSPRLPCHAPSSTPTKSSGDTGRPRPHRTTPPSSV